MQGKQNRESFLQKAGKVKSPLELIDINLNGKLTRSTTFLSRAESVSKKQRNISSADQTHPPNFQSLRHAKQTRVSTQKDVNLKLFKNGGRRLKRADKYQTLAGESPIFMHHKTRIAFSVGVLTKFTKNSECKSLAS